jgi:hypothetical protein
VGATAVQVVYSSRRGSRDIEHIGSAYDEAELEALKAAAQHTITAADPLPDGLRQAPTPSTGPAEVCTSLVEIRRKLPRSACRRLTLDLQSLMRA